MRLILISFGKIKTDGLRRAADHYLKLLRPWMPFEEIELKSSPVPDKNPLTRLSIQKKEADQLVAHLKQNGYPPDRVIFINENGRPSTTKEWADRFRHWQQSGRSEIIFCIGGSLGFSKELRESYKEWFNLGSQTMSHELARVVLFEQLYRSISFLKGHPYHNEG
ncbi:MAG TPA: 23S rRNA (pseudouridine(1915)-N(3))-methyltransferase RlmH [Elusimicrobiota bacterium]|nr:23S rRNA (pseudouridine(1915)-N(3))-methyltransferase RlmH [Elusimicrobiota bacterium]